MIGSPDVVLSPEEVTAFVTEQLAAADLDGRSVCLVIPDGTRSSPLPLLLSAIHGALIGRVTRLTAVIALGTHQAMTDAQIAKHLGVGDGGVAATYPGMTVLNHAWWDPDTFVSVGRISAQRVHELSEGRLAIEADVRLNRAVVEHDVALVVGPVFPHEVVGFSGGNTLPRGRRSGDHRPHALGRRAHHEPRDHRHPRHHAGACPHRRRRLAAP